MERVRQGGTLMEPACWRGALMAPASGGGES